MYVATAGLLGRCTPHTTTLRRSVSCHLTSIPIVKERCVASPPLSIITVVRSLEPSAYHTRTQPDSANQTRSGPPSCAQHVTDLGDKLLPPERQRSASPTPPSIRSSDTPDIPDAASGFSSDCADNCDGSGDPLSDTSEGVFSQLDTHHIDVLGSSERGEIAWSTSTTGHSVPSGPAGHQVFSTYDIRRSLCLPSCVLWLNYWFLLLVGLSSK